MNNTSEDKKQNAKVENEPENDLRLMFKVISSAVVNTPPPNPMVTMLQSKANVHHFDHETDEDAVPLFNIEVSGAGNRREKCFLNRRNWSDIIPVENALKNEYLAKLYNVKIGDKVMPGIVSPETGLYREKTTKKLAEKGFFQYPITEKGVVVSLNMETEPENPHSKSTRYCLPIPELRTTCAALSHSGLKH